MLAIGAMTSGCSQWLQVYPQNDQVSDYLWNSQEDVEGVVNSTYYYFRALVEPYLIPYGELRGGTLYSRYAGNLQMFRVKSTDKSFANWGPFYQIINISNIVLANADKVLAVDKTYDENMMKAHKAEALYMRALCYFYLVRNWRDVPLVLDPYENDNATFKVKQSTEAQVIAQIKKDLNAAIDSKAAKAFYDTNWETKGRATIWSMYALMADVCLWSGDYADAETYSDKILNPASSYSGVAPRFLSTPTRDSWFSMFNPGNSNESIFEVEWDVEKDQSNSLTQNFSWSISDVYRYTPQMAKDFLEEYALTQKNGLEEVRTSYGGCYMRALDGTSTDAWCWKYVGSITKTEPRTSDSYDSHYIIYRVADIMLMKAEALVQQGQSRYQEAIDLINQIRERSNLKLRTDLDPSKSTELEMLQAVLYERQMELAGEGKIWYDILRMGRAKDKKYWDALLVAHVLEYKYNSSSDSWVRGVFSNGDDAMFMPVWEQELEYNDLLVQNPYYK
jgi:hypothetical protein